MPTNKKLKSKNERNAVAFVFGLLAIFFVSVLVGAAIGIGSTQAIKRFAVVNRAKTETIAQANSGTVLGEKDFRIAQATSFFHCAKAPYGSSPACRGEHPRLHITQDTLPDFRIKISTYYKSDYQKFVDWLNSEFNSSYSGNRFTPNGGLMADYHALVYLLGPIDEINYPRPISDHGQRAIQIMMDTVAANQSVGSGYPRIDDYAVVARTYDWMWSQLTEQQKLTIVTWLADNAIIILNGVGPNYTLGIRNGKISSLWSSTSWGSILPWYHGLAFYNDGIRDADAQTLVNSFETLMLNGAWLDAQNWVARDQGGLSEVGTYGIWHPRMFIQYIDGWKTATEEDYFSRGTSIAEAYTIQYLPQWFAYRIKPYAKANPSRPGGAEWKMIKLGQFSVSYIGLYESNLNYLLTDLESPIKNINPDMASLNRWLLKNRAGDNMVYGGWTYFDQFLWGDRSIPAKSPAELGLPKSQFFEGLGMAVMRTGFESMDDTAILVGAPPYQLGGHDWASWELFQAGFTIDKYGPLAIHKQGYLRGDKAYRKNMMRFTDPLKVPDSGFIKEQAGVPVNVRDYAPGSRYDIGGMKRTIFESDYDYLYMDYTKYYTPDRITKYTRQFAYLKPETRNSSDYIVIFDRAVTPRPDIIKRFEVNMAYNPVINGAETLVSEGKWEYTGGDQITISNNNDPDPYNGQSYGAHGRLFIKSLLPEQKKIVKVGGPGHEFDYDEGPIDYQGKPGDYAELSQGGAFYTGTYYTDVVALGNNSQENFLHVLQTADANFVSQMTPAVRVDGDTVVGAYIQDATQGYKVVMFSKTEANQTQATYTIPATTVNIAHLIADLAPNFTYNVYQGGTKIASKLVGSAGTLSFSSQGAGTFQVTQGAPNLPPVVTASANPMSGITPLAVNFTATASDPDGTIASYVWNFGDNGTATAQNPTHTYSTAGTYMAKVEVTDNGGATASATVAITVNSAPVLTPNLTLTKTVDKSTAISGETLTYIIQYENIGQGEAQKVVITDKIPQGTTYIINSATGNSAFDGATITWTISTLAPSASGSVSFQAKVE